LVRAQISHRGYARLERAHRALARQEHLDRRRIAGQLLQHRIYSSGLCGRRLVRIDGHVRVDVNQPGQSGVFRQIDDFSAGRDRRRIGRYAANALAFHNHDGIRPNLPLGIPQLAELHRLNGSRVRLFLSANCSPAKHSQKKYQENLYRLHTTCPFA
jgi:hypothetical protein